MKKILYVICLAAGSLLAGCEFLDVNPAGNVKDGKMFEDVQGYRDAMFGAYATIAKAGLYGDTLSYNFADQLGQLFYNTSPQTDLSTKIRSYKYDDVNVRSITDSIWIKSYEAISYVNNILVHVEDENLSSDPDFPYIKGEALALRAFLHFDVLRYFCDNIIINPTAGGIPYAYSYDLKNKQLFSLEKTYENVLKDLSDAEELMKDETAAMSGSSFMNNRHNHLNLQAVRALTARVLHTQGKTEKAAEYAVKVIESQWYSLATDPATQLDTLKKYPAPNMTSSELIWGLFNNKLYGNMYDLFLSSSRYEPFARLMPREDLRTAVYEADSWGTFVDYRWQSFFKTDTDNNGYAFIRLLNVDVNDQADVVKQRANTRGVCMLRLPEMYYIAAEGLYNTDPGRAVQYLEDVRTSRGLRTPIGIASYDQLLEELYKERRKEMYGEGQIFLEHKRRNADLRDVTGASGEAGRIPASKEIFVLPWPEKELEFGESNKPN